MQGALLEGPKKKKHTGLSEIGNGRVQTSRKPKVLRALLSKNYTLKKKRGKATCCELLVPVLFLLMLMAIKSTSQREVVPQGWSIGEETDPYDEFLAEAVELRGLIESFDFFGFGRLALVHSGEQREIDALNSFTKFMEEEGVASTGQFDGFSDLTVVIGDGQSQDLQDYIESETYGSPFSAEAPEIYAAVIFEHMDFENAIFDYTLRLNSSLNFFVETVRTDLDPVNELQRGIESSNFRTYTRAGFISLQQLVDSFIIAKSLDNYSAFPLAVDPANADVQQERLVFQPGVIRALAFPVGEFTTDIFFELAGDVMTIFLALAYLLPMSQVVSVIVLEKEVRAREMMNLMGVSDFKIIASWYLTYSIIFTITAFIITLVAGALFPATAEASGGFSFLIFFLFTFYGVAVISFGFFISTFFHKSFNGVVAGLVLYLMLFFMYFFFDSFDEPPTIGLMIPQVSFAFCISTIVAFEKQGIGASAVLFSSKIEGFALSTGFTWLILDILIYAVVGFYLNAVIPRKFGTSMKWNFPFTKRFWKKVLGLPSSSNDPAEEHINQNNQIDLSPAIGDTFEPPSESMKQELNSQIGVQIRGISKVFNTPDGDKVAVNNLNLDIFEGQILVLLGHNGAGKTTLLQMLAGSLSATSGEAFIYGNSLRHEIEDIRTNLGFCPQHDLLWNELSVYDHLKFYGSVKGLKGRNLKEAILKSVQQVGLTEKLKVAARKLSGGMKRKLSLAISLMGDNKVIFVDEPTSGVDTFSRRSMWEVLQNCKEGRVIVLTTHFMDEADILGDRIAIMADGKLQCVGSSLFLKRLYGAGYELTFVKKKNCDLDAVQEVVMNFVQGAEMTSNIGSELRFYLPLSETKTFADLFSELDERLEANDLEISSYGVSVTTMEAVFMKAGQSDDLLAGAKMFEKGELEDIVHEDVDENENINSSQPQHSPHIFAIIWFWKQFSALFLKRVHYAKRDSYSFLCSTLVPITIFAVGLAAITFSPIAADMPSMKLSVDGWNPGFDVKGFLPIVELSSNDAAIEFGRGRLAQAGNFPDFVLNQPFAQRTDVPSGVRSVFDVIYDDGKRIEDCTGYYFTCGFSSLTSATANAILDLSEAFFDPDEIFKPQIEARNGASDFAALIIQPEEANSQLRYSYTIMANTSANHVAPIVANSMHTALLRRSLVEYFNFSDVDAFEGSSIEFEGSSSEFGQDEGGVQGEIDVQFSFPSDARAPRITTRSFPFPAPRGDKEFAKLIIGALAAVFCVLAFAFVPAPMISYIVMEKEEAVQIKHLQFVSGAGIIPYWISNYVFDLVSYTPCFVASLVLLSLFRIDAFLEDDALRVVAIAMFGYGVAVVPFAYFIGHFFKKHTSALTWIIVINCLLGLVSILASAIMGSLDSTKDLNDSLKLLYRLFPGFCLGDSLLQMALISEQNGENRKSYLDADVAGTNIVFLFLDAIIFLCLTIGIEYLGTRPSLDLYKKLFPASKKSMTNEEQLDEDVKAEEARVIAEDELFREHGANADVEGGLKEDVLRMIHLRKEYGKKVAVKDVTLGIPEGQCFGYLGVNGAGKTTTLKCLTGDVFPTSGRGYIHGLNIKSQQNQVRQHIGYCSQNSSILGLLTVNEHLQLFCNLKQVKNVQETVQKLLKRLSLVPFANKLARTLSGGNKRKLSVAIAMIGSPTVMLLDEPSTGMDVASRRFMWNVIENMVSGAYDGKKTSVVLTTHSMEECEALCSRVAIMVDGGLKCLGSVQHLKSRFGTGFTMDIKLEQVERDAIVEVLETADLDGEEVVKVEDVEAICTKIGFQDASILKTGSRERNALLSRFELNGTISVYFLVEQVLQYRRVDELSTFLKERFNGLEVVEAHDQKLTFRVEKDDSTRLSDLFETLEMHKTELKIAEYSVSQTTLEQIFNGFASQQEQ